MSILLFRGINIITNIAVFGGSFDPPHFGHQTIIQKAIDSLDIDKLIVVPAYINPFKKGTLYDANTRFYLVEKMCKNIKNVEVSDFEISKQTISFTIDTVLHFKNIYLPNKIYLIIGEDNLLNLQNWHMFEELNSLVTFVVVSRQGYENITHHYQVLNVNENISSTEIRKKIKGEKLEKRIENIKEILDSKKAENIEVFDVTDKGYLVDFVVIATTLNGKHGYALLDYLKEDLKLQGEEFLRVDEDDDWMVIDLGDILIHLMSEKYRTKYSLETFLNDIVGKK